LLSACRPRSVGCETGRPLLIDAHDRPVESDVWEMFASVIARTGALPTLIEWDANVPPWATLKAQADRAEAILFGSNRRFGTERPDVRKRLSDASFVLGAEA
jgi:uncharacterized protein (UPF0276 family)